MNAAPRKGLARLGSGRRSEAPSSASDAVEARLELQRRAVLNPSGGLYAFTRLAWEHMEPVPFKGGKHLQLICAHLEAVTFGRCKRLVINQPPGTSKSSLVSVIWPLWEWLFHPHIRFMFATFDDTLATRDSDRSRMLLNSEWFRTLFGDLCGHAPGECRHPRVVQDFAAADTLGIWYTNGGGFRFSTTPKSRATGWHAHRQVIDDPTKPQDVLGGVTDAINALTSVETWFKGTMATRKADPDDFARVIVMQRLHDADLAGSVLDEKGAEWVHLCLPMEYVPERHCRTTFGEDWRTERGEPLCPDRFGPEAIAELKRDMGPILYESQGQQNPAPPGGEIIREEWIRETTESIESLLSRGGDSLVSIDCTFEDGDSVDRVSIQYWINVGDDFYLMDAYFTTMSFVATLDAARTFFIRYPDASVRIVEKKANGPAIVSSMQAEFSGLLLAEPRAEKKARAVAVTPAFAAGRVYIRAGQDWTQEVKEEWYRFPKRRHDDNVDAMTQALAYWLSDDSEWVRHMGAIVEYYFPGTTRKAR